MLENNFLNLLLMSPLSAESKAASVVATFEIILASQGITVCASRLSQIEKIDATDVVGDLASVGTNNLP